MKKLLLVPIALVLILSLVLSGCSGGSKDANPPPAGTATNQTAPPASPRGITGTISTGQVAQSSPIPVTTQGGRFTLNKPGEVLNGMVLAVPPNSYSGDKQFAISYAPIEKHTFGENFNPITPLIKIDNGGAFSDEIMEVTIPCQVSPGSFAMGFIYDEKTKTLEGLPTLAQDASSITVGTRHFSDLLITQISEEILKKDIDSHFRPGIDDWQFVNRGSYIAKGGHCTGQSMTAMWYYETQPDGKDLTLNGRYDNNGQKPATPNLWEDDSNTYRFASVVWKEMDWGSWGRELTEKYVAKSDKATYNMFAYAMLMTGQPQMTEIWNTPVGGGHAMIVYRVFQNNLYIADPNYPGNTDRRIEFDGSQFKPYNSGENADEIAKGNGKAYDRITFCFKTSLSDWNSLSAHWQEVKNGTIGKGLFPDYKIVYKDSAGQYPELKDGYVSPSRLLALAVEIPNVQIGWRVLRDGVQLNKDANGNYELLPGPNKLGIHIVIMVDGVDKNGNPIQVPKYVDFKYLTVIYNGSSLAIDPSSLDGEPNKSYTFTAKLEGAPANTVYEWSVDGVSVQKTASNTLARTFPEGNHEVAVKALDGSGKELASAKSAVVIKAKPTAVNNLAILQKFNAVNGYVAGGKYTYDVSTPAGSSTETQNNTFSIPWGSSDYGTLKITWAGTSFSGKINYKKDSTTYTAEVTGTVSADGTVLQTFTYKGQRNLGNTASDKYALINVHSYTLNNLQLIVMSDESIAKSKPGEAVTIQDSVEEWRDGKFVSKKTFKSAEWSAISENRLRFSSQP